MRNRRRRAEQVISILIALILIYLAGWFILFDRAEAAWLFDAEYDMHGKQLVAGPRPRHWVLHPPYHDFLYTGEEWPFRVYSLFCRQWAAARGYALESPTP